jgi:hypothetical protein
MCIMCVTCFGQPWLEAAAAAAAAADSSSTCRPTGLSLLLLLLLVVILPCCLAHFIKVLLTGAQPACLI